MVSVRAITATMELPKRLVALKLIKQNFLNYNPSAAAQPTANAALNACTTLDKSYIAQPSNGNGTTSCGTWAQFVVAEVRLRDLHDVFSSMCLSKGSFWRMQLSLNNCSFGFNLQQASTANGDNPATVASMYLTSMNVPSAGVNPLMLASAQENNGASSLLYGAAAANAGAGGPVTPYIASCQVGSSCLSSTQAQAMGPNYPQSSMLRSITLCTPLYSLSPDIEMAYISQQQKKIVYDDLYTYQVFNISGSGTGSVNQIISNGLQSPQSMYVVPLVSGSSNNLGSAYTGSLSLPAFQEAVQVTT